MLTHKRLLEILYYNPDTGDWIWIVQKGSRAMSGNKAGTLDEFGYRKIIIDGKSYRSGRLAWFYMKGYFPEHKVDHEDRNRSNDKWDNLRHISHQCNNKNRGLFKKNKSGVTGIRRRRKKWLAEITINKKFVYLGSFNKFYDAVKARWKAEVKFGWPDCNYESTAYKYLNMKRIKA